MKGLWAERVDDVGDPARFSERKSVYAAPRNPAKKEHFRQSFLPLADFIRDGSGASASNVFFHSPL